MYFKTINFSQYIYIYLFFLWRCGPTRAMASSITRFLDHTQRRTTVGRTPLDERSARRRDLYLTTHNTHDRQTSMPPGGIRTHDLRKRAAAELRLRPRGYWDLRIFTLCTIKEKSRLDNNAELYTRPKRGFPCRSYKILVYCLCF